MVDRIERQIARTWHRVIHIGRAQQLAIAVIGTVFHQRLTDPLCQTAVDLTCHNHRVHDIAKVVSSRKPFDGDMTGFRVQLDLAGIGTRRVGKVRRIVKRRLFQTRFNVFQRIVVRHVRGQGHISPSHGFIRAGHAERTIFQLDIALGRFQQV